MPRPVRGRPAERGAGPTNAPPRPPRAARGGGGAAAAGPHCSGSARPAGSGRRARSGPSAEPASRRQTGRGRRRIPPRAPPCRPRAPPEPRPPAPGGLGGWGWGLGARPGPCARCPDDAARRARPPGARSGPGPVARGAGGGPRARLRAVRAPLPLRPDARLRLPRQLLRPRTADARTRAAHPRRRHRAVSTPPLCAAGRAVAMAPEGRRDSGGARGVRRSRRACTLGSGERPGRAGRRPGGPRRAWARPRPLKGKRSAGQASPRARLQRSEVGPTK